MAISLAQIKPSRILQLQHKTWRQLGEMVKKWIWADMRKGHCQEYLTSGAYRYSRDYAKYKANNMRRFTGKSGKKLKVSGAKNKRETIDRSFGLSSGSTKGGRLKGYEGKKIVSTNVGSVNMLLTGELIEGLRVVRSSRDKVVLSYAKKDEGKIIGNEALGRSIRTLNEVNQEKALKYLEKQFIKNIKDWERDPVRIKL